MAQKKTKILFINPVIRRQDTPKEIPYGMAQLAALTRKEGYLLQVLDANALRPSDTELQEALSEDDWDIVATGGLITTYGYIKKCVRYARQICPQALIVAGGGFLSAIPREIMGLLPEIDAGIIGEGVVTFPELLRRVEQGEKDFSEVSGLIWRDKDGCGHITEERPLLEDLDSLPYPAYDLFPMDVYFQNSSLLLSEEAMQAQRRISVMAGYGCPFKCKFCFHLGLSGEIKHSDSDVIIDFQGKRKVRFHSPEYVIDLIKYARESFGIDFVSFIDENFVYLDSLTQGKWSGQFFELWMENGLLADCIRRRTTHNPQSCRGIHWGTTAHAALVTPALLKRMRDMGCSYLDYGFESFSDDILKSMSKGATVQINEQALKWTIEAGIRPVPNQIIGFPDESFASIKAMVSAWNRLGIKSYPFLATAYPGSEWYVKYKERILSQYGGELEAFLLDLGDATKISAVISERFNAVELLGLRELMVNNDLRRIEEYENRGS